MKAHKAVLALLSPKLKDMLNQESNKTELTLEGSEKYLVRAFEFLYKGKIQDISDEDGIQLLDISNRYDVFILMSHQLTCLQIELLKNAVGNYLADNSSEENLSYLLNIAHKYNCNTLLHRCGQFIAENFNSMPKSILMDFEPDVWRGILMVIHSNFKSRSSHNLEQKGEN